MVSEKIITLFEIPGVVLRRKSDGEILGEVLTKYPKHSQLMVAAALREALDVDVKLVDMKAENPDKVELYEEAHLGNEVLEKLVVGAEFESVNPQIQKSNIIGVTANFTYESNMVGRFILYAKGINPNAKIVIGGSDATARPEIYLNFGANVVMLGKAEITGPKAIKNLFKQKSLDEVSSIAYMDKRTESIKINPRDKKDITDVEKLPLPALDLGLKYDWSQAAEGGLPEGVSRRVGVLETSRGCDEACSFCATTFQIGLYRSMSQRRILENLEHLKSNGIETIIIIDDNILYKLKQKYGEDKGRKELIELFNHMKKEEFAWAFYNGIQFGLLEKDGQIDSELIDAMFQNNSQTRKFNEKYIGAFRAYIPLERLTEKEITKFRKLKPFEVQDKIIEEIGMRKTAMLNMGFIIGYPHENEDYIRQMGDRAEYIKGLVHRASEGKTKTNFIPFCLIPIPGTPDYRRMQREGRFAYDIMEHPELMNGYASIVNGDFFTANGITNRRMLLAKILNE